MNCRLFIHPQWMIYTAIAFPNRNSFFTVLEYKVVSKSNNFTTQGFCEPQVPLLLTIRYSIHLSIKYFVTCAKLVYYEYVLHLSLV